MLSVLLILPDFLIILLGYLLKQGKLGQHFDEGFWKVSTLWGLSPKTKRGREPSFAYGQSNVLPGQPSASP